MADVILQTVIGIFPQYMNDHDVLLQAVVDVPLQAMAAVLP